MRVLLASLGLLATACTSITSTPLPSEQVGGGYVHTSFNWSSGNKVAFAYRVYEEAGTVAICGIYAESPGGDSDIAPFNDRLVQTASLEVGGETLINDISFFARGQYTDRGRASGKATCVRIDDPWTPKMARKWDLVFAKTHFTVYD